MPFAGIRKSIPGEEKISQIAFTGIHGRIMSQRIPDSNNWRQYNRSGRWP